MYIPRGIAQQGQLAAAITEVEQLLGPDVVRLRYTIRENWSEEPAIFFRVLLSDEASEHRLHQVASRVKAIIEEHLDPFNSWELIPYYNFRSQTEQDIPPDLRLLTQAQQGAEPRFDGFTLSLQSRGAKRVPHQFVVR